MGLNKWAGAQGTVFSQLWNLRATCQHNVVYGGARGQTGGSLGCLGHALLLHFLGRRVMPTWVVLPGVGGHSNCGNKRKGSGVWQSWV